MSPIEMRIAKRELHKTITDLIIYFEPDDDEWNELWTYVEILAMSEKRS